MSSEWWLKSRNLQREYVKVRLVQRAATCSPIAVLSIRVNTCNGRTGYAHGR
jgi:hypothetical protein